MAGRRREQVEYVYAQPRELKAALYHAYGARGPDVTHLALVCRTCRAKNVFRVQDVEDKHVGTMVRSFLTLWDRHTCGAYVLRATRAPRA